MSKALHILISGQVQGVGYRSFAQTHAESFGLVGWTRNLTDGRVEILVQATLPEKIQLFLNFLKQGPRRSQVMDVAVQEVFCEFDSDGFHIRSDGSEEWR